MLTEKKDIVLLGDSVPPGVPVDSVVMGIEDHRVHTTDVFDVFLESKNRTRTDYSSGVLVKEEPVEYEDLPADPASPQNLGPDSGLLGMVHSDEFNQFVAPVSENVLKPATRWDETPAAAGVFWKDPGFYGFTAQHHPFNQDAQSFGHHFGGGYAAPNNVPQMDGSLSSASSGRSSVEQNLPNVFDASTGSGTRQWQTPNGTNFLHAFANNILNAHGFAGVPVHAPNQQPMEQRAPTPRNIVTTLAAQMDPVNQSAVPAQSNEAPASSGPLHMLSAMSAQAHGAPQNMANQFGRHQASLHEAVPAQALGVRMSPMGQSGSLHINPHEIVSGPLHASHRPDSGPQISPSHRSGPLHLAAPDRHQIVGASLSPANSTGNHMPPALSAQAGGMGLSGPLHIAMVPPRQASASSLDQSGPLHLAATMPHNVVGATQNPANHLGDLNRFPPRTAVPFRVGRGYLPDAEWDLVKRYVSANPQCQWAESNGVPGLIRLSDRTFPQIAPRVPNSNLNLWFLLSKHQDGFVDRKAWANVDEKTKTVLRELVKDLKEEMELQERSGWILPEEPKTKRSKKE